jgi:hypothetical protein
MTEVADPDHGCNPETLAWLDACCEVGRWPGVLGFLLWRVKATSPEWCFRGSLLHLWRDIDARHPHWIEQDDFVAAWSELAHASLVYSVRGGGWSCAVVSAPGPSLAPVPDSGVYFVREGTSGPIKIGCSKSITKRISYLQVGASEPLVLLAVFVGGREEERSLHARFAACRVRGEWFDAEPVMAWLAAYQEASS